MIDVKHMVDAMLTAESLLAAQGWGRDPSMMMLGNDLGGITIAEVPARMTSGHAVYRAGMLAAQDPAKAKIVATRYPHFIAMAFASESWSIISSDPSINEETVEHHPDARVCREITAVDIWGRAFNASRVRGEQPVAAETFLAGGRIPFGLLQIVISLAQHLPHADWRHLNRVLASLDPNIDADGAYRTDKAVL